MPFREDNGTVLYVFDQDDAGRSAYEELNGQHASLLLGQQWVLHEELRLEFDSEIHFEGDEGYLPLVIEI